MLVDYHSCRVYLAEGGELVPIAVKGEEAREARTLSGLRVPIGFGITGGVAESGRASLARTSTTASSASSSCPEGAGDESLAAVPLRYGSRVDGVIFLSQLGVGRFDENDVRLLEVLAGYAASRSRTRGCTRAAPGGRAHDGMARVLRRSRPRDRWRRSWTPPSRRSRSLMEADQARSGSRTPKGTSTACVLGYEEDPGAERARARTAGHAEEFIRSRKMPFMIGARSSTSSSGGCRRRRR